jgi:hypothetical protein
VIRLQSRKDANTRSKIASTLRNASGHRKRLDAGRGQDGANIGIAVLAAAGYNLRRSIEAKSANARFMVR